MASESAHEITTFLNQSESFNLKTQSELQKMVYLDLKRIAANRLATESSQNTMTVTALVHEAFMRLDSVHSMTWKSRRHYFGAAAESMRRILIDRARYYLTKRREGAKSVMSLDEGLLLDGVKPTELIQLDDAMTDLESLDKELADILKLKYFAGLSAHDIAQLYETSPRTMARKIKSGRAWLSTQLDGE